MHVSTSPTTLTPTPDRTLDQSLNTLFAVPWHAGLYFRALTSAGESIVSQTQYLSGSNESIYQEARPCTEWMRGPEGGTPVSGDATTLTPTPDRTLDQNLNILFAVPWHAGLYFRALTSAGESIVSQTQYLQARMKVYIRRRDLALDGCEGPKGERVSRIYGEMQQEGVHNLSHGL